MPWKAEGKCEGRTYMETGVTIALLSAAVLCVIAVVLVCILLHHGRKIAALQRRVESAESTIVGCHDEAMRFVEEKADDIISSYGSESARMDSALRHTEGAILSMITQISQSQTTLMESIQRQIISIGRNQEDRLNSISREISEKLSQQSAQLEQIREWLGKSMTQLRQENNQQLSEIRGTVDEKLTSALDKKLSSSFAQVSSRLEQVYKGLGEMQNLAAGVGDLKKVLTNVKTRGIWGEMQVEAIIRQVLSPNQYDTNVAVVPDSQERVEFAIKLPGKNNAVTYLPIDSKFPQEDYIRLNDAYNSCDTVQIEASRKAIVQRIKLEGKRIAEKYIQPPYTTDFAVMFLPVEGLYSEVVQIPGIVEELQNSLKVVVSGPSTFSALLNALQMGFRTLAIEKRSSEVWNLLGQVKTDFGKFSDVLIKTRQKLQQATDSLDSAYSKTITMQRRLGSVEALDSAEDTEDAPEA